MHHKAVRRQPRGFTLLEVMIAVAVGGVIMLAARATVETVTVANQLIAASSRSQDAQRNAARDFQALIGRLVVDQGSRRFTGYESSLDFATWCVSPRGWLESCRVVLRCGRSGDVWTTVIVTNGVSAELERGFGPLEFRYLVSVGGELVWMNRWESTTTAPVAVGIISATDTMLARVGARG